ncbi:SLC13 family permease [Neomoorella thermoacetica]|uniref:Sodium-dependent dicarboxylate transporter SdcS n=2 Tax=Neomoorella thermoacetica TaxID=1525 RepID=A0A1J5NKM9_NEOTH|nr:DASS family sodium-coupled anion symporter [Moorella thermoacetica]AKX97744.1 sodium-dependent dicarboxylate transporter SdcS [Moorella thermoacetica]OIQ07861.1 sodium-dependent dicarboxylate transporter SdcS [Moorella thermoacetica]OIQ10688.1 sodium-dependent dicarboxylate transporter SdcS [Moorella thermoacetica]OIQ53250.1 sodium-dependent dicarboxylate transporter SdcS [Moorella thermoacetica]OIQ56575.1 sodium-dependent dicarboxylate transporter SdcS [Moorella thermoacetica]
MATATQTGTQAVATGKKAGTRWAYFIIGLAVLGLFYILPVPAGMKPAAMRTLGVMATTVFWWLTETLPIPVTALMVPLMLHFTGILSLDKSVAQSFGDSFVPFLIGVLALSVAFTMSGLGKRITYLLLALSGTKVSRVIGIYFLVSFVISMFVTDVAVVAMMLPIVVGLLQSVDAKPGESNLGRGLMMAIMFGSTLGGICTPSGVASNVITMSFLTKNAKIGVSFLDWVAIATPIFVAVGIIAWWLILKIFPPEIKELPYGKDMIHKELKGMGSWSIEEITTMVVFLLAVVLWLTSSWNGLPIAFVSLLILGLLSMPGVGVFKKWSDVEKRLEWGALMLVVGGFALGLAASQSGLAQWVAQHALKPMTILPRPLQPLAVTLLVAVDSLGFSSFTAAASVNVPFIIAYAQQNALPVLSMALAAGFAASTHFILVTESPSFVLPYAYGYFSFKDLFKIGVILTIVSAGAIAIGLVLAGMPAGVPLH